MGLCPPGGALLDDGEGHYSPNNIQMAMWEYWLEFWEKWVPMVTRGEPYSVVVNGDLVDGVHHGSVSQISHNLIDQTRIAIECLRPIRQNKRVEKFFVLRGTPVHGGQSGQQEEQIGEALNATKISRMYSAYELWLKIGAGLVHLTHHIGTSGAMAYESSALMSELAAAYNEAGRWRKDPPDVIVRSHRHRCITVKVPSARTSGIVVTTPGWQAKTPFCFKIAGARQADPQFGGLLVRFGDEDGLYVRERVWCVDGRS